jgi:hypothetical protein
MYHNFKAVSLTKPFKVIILTCITVLLYTSVNSQMYSATDPPKRNNDGLTYGDSNGGNGGGGDRTWGLSFSAGYDMPQGDMSQSFKAAPTFSLSYLNYYGDFTFNATIGYTSYKPKFDTVDFVDGDPTQGYLQYGSYNSFQLYAGAAYNVAISDNAKVYFGLDFGNYFNSFNYTLNDGQGNTSTYNTVYSQQFIAPKIGVDVMVSDNLSLGLEAKYNFIFSGPQSADLDYSDDDVDAYVSTSYTSLSYKTFSGHVTLTYHFN